MSNNYDVYSWVVILRQVVAEFDWQFDTLDEFTENLVEEEALPKDKAAEFKVTHVQSSWIFMVSNLYRWSLVSIALSMILRARAMVMSHSGHVAVH